MRGEKNRWSAQLAKKIQYVRRCLVSRTSLYAVPVRYPRPLSDIFGMLARLFYQYTRACITPDSGRVIPHKFSIQLDVSIACPIYIARPDARFLKKCQHVVHVVTHDVFLS